MKHHISKLLLFSLLFAGSLIDLAAESTSERPLLSAAVLDFQASDPQNRDAGSEIAIMLGTLLAGEEGLLMVEREELDKLLSEQELGLSGMINAGQAAQVGRLTGAKVLITGRAFFSGDNFIAVARIMGTETSRVFGEMVTVAGDDRVSAAAFQLAEKVASTLREKGDQLVAPTLKPEERIVRLRELVEGKKLPTVSIRIPEEHIGRLILDPAAETEIGNILGQLGFELLDADDSGARPDVLIRGEAFSELGMRRGNLVSCRARVELKVTERGTGRVLLFDRQTETGIDLSESIAAKNALQDGAARLTDRLVPALVNAFN